MSFAARRLALLTPPWGLEGGRPGGRSAFRLGDAAEPFVMGAGRLRPGETVEIVTPGAGGYGPPAERDLADGRIDLISAAAIYPQSRR